jgi:hypothetical protein
MLRRLLRSRLLILIAVWQTGVPPVLAVMDGLLSRDGSQATHFEDRSGTHCRPHGPDCGICRYLANAAAAPAPQTVCVTTAVRVMRPQVISVVRSLEARSGFLSRAPPALLG